MYLSTESLDPGCVGYTAGLGKPCVDGGDGTWAGSSMLSGWEISVPFLSGFVRKRSSSSISSLPPKCSQSEGPPAANALNVDLSSRGGGGVENFCRVGFGDAVLFSARWAQYLAKATEFIESARL